MELLDLKSFEGEVREYQNLVNARLNEVLQARKPDNLYEPIRYALQSGGKRVRPILLLLACEAAGGERSKAIDAAAAIELLHNFTLVHDDIMDQDDTRRGLPTVHKKWNSDTALLAGDGLVSLAYQTLLLTDSPRIHEIARVFTDGIVELCEGQALDYDFENRRHVELTEYLAMIGKKTARLLRISAEIGAILADAPTQVVQALGDFGHNLGCAFQIQDDLLDITADEKTLGKTYGSDIIRKKQTYLLIHALNHADAATKKQIIDAVYTTNNHRPNIDRIRRLFDAIGSIKAARSAIKGYINSAKTNLESLPPSHGRESLSQMLEFIAARKA